MQELYDPRTWNDRETATALALMAFKTSVKEQRQRYLELNSFAEPDPEKMAQYEDQITLGLGMLRYYASQVLPYYDQGFTPIGVEVPFEVPILDPQGQPTYCKCKLCWRRQVRYWQGLDQSAHVESIQELTGDPEKDRLFCTPWKGLPLTYGGRIDMLAVDTEGHYWIWDWKTTIRVFTAEPGSEDDFMLLDDQITSYCWAIDLLGRLNGGHIPVAGFVYAELKKGYPLEPEPLKSMRLGRRFSVNKQQDTDYETYQRIVSQNDPQAYEDGLYEEFLQYLHNEGPVYHKRSQISRNGFELYNAGVNIWLEALDIIDPNKRIYPSPGRFACQTCAYKAPCLAQNRGEDFQYMLDSMYEKRAYKYWENVELSTDKRSRG